MSNLALSTNIEPIFDNLLHDRFEAFLNSQSNGTAKAYRTDIAQFCKYIFNKEPKHVTLNQFLSLTSLEATRFYNYLKDEMKFKNATLKRKVNAVKSFLDALKVDYREINENIFDNLNLKSANLDQNSYGNLDWDEAFLMIEYAHIEQMEGDQMAMLLKLACITSVRLSALLSLNWEDNFRTKNEKGVLVNFIDVVDKMQRHEIPLSKAFYDELQDMLGSTGKLFPNLHEHKVGRLLKEILSFFEIDPKRNIKFHSFKKCGVNRVLERTGDLTKAQVQGKHKSIVTTNNYYVKLKDDLTQKPSYTLDQELNINDMIKDLSHNDLVNAISQLSDSAKWELARIIDK